MDFENMSGPELVRAFNAMANSVTGQEIRAQPVTRFADVVSGRKRCLALASSIKAREQGLAAAAAAAAAAAPALRQTNSIMEQFKVKPNKFRGKLLAKLHANLGTPVSTSTLVQAVYGNNGNAGALKMVLRGLRLSIKKDKLPYELIKSKMEGETSYGLYAKGKAERN